MAEHPAGWTMPRGAIYAHFFGPNAETSGCGGYWYNRAYTLKPEPPDGKRHCKGCKPWAEKYSRLSKPAEGSQQ